MFKLHLNLKLYSFNDGIFQLGEEKVNEMKVQKDNMERVTKMVAEEVQALKAQCDRERENAKIMKIEAERVRSIGRHFKT